MNSNILEDLLHHELQSIYSTEKQMHKALTKMTQVACDSTLRTVFMRRLRESDDQVQRLEHIARLIGKGLEGPKCQGMKQLIEEEARESLFNSPSRHETYDAGLIAAASQFVSDEIDRYDLAGGLASRLGLEDVERLLQADLNQQKLLAARLSKLKRKLNARKVNAAVLIRPAPAFPGPFIAALRLMGGSGLSSPMA